LDFGETISRRLAQKRGELKIKFQGLLQNVAAALAESRTSGFSEIGDTLPGRRHAGRKTGGFLIFHFEFLI
jgi:hypothetical protein